MLAKKPKKKEAVILFLGPYDSIDNEMVKEAKKWIDEIDDDAISIYHGFAETPQTFEMNNILRASRMVANIMDIMDMFISTSLVKNIKIPILVDTFKLADESVEITFFSDRKENVSDIIKKLENDGYTVIVFDDQYDDEE